MLDDFHGVLLGVSACNSVQNSHPNEVANQNDNNSHQADGQLLGDGALICQVNEGQADEEGQDGDNDLGDQIQNDLLELLQNANGGLSLGPDSSQADQHGEDQCGHDGHDLGDAQCEDVSGQLLQSSSFGSVVHDGDQDVASAHGQQSSQNGGNVSNDQSNAQQLGSIATQLGDGGSDEADNDQGNDEVDQLAHNVLNGNQDLQDGLGNDQADHDTDDDAQQQLSGQTG